MLGRLWCSLTFACKKKKNESSWIDVASFLRKKSLNFQGAILLRSVRVILFWPLIKIVFRMCFFVTVSVYPLDCASVDTLSVLFYCSVISFFLDSKSNGFRLTIEELRCYFLCLGFPLSWRSSCILDGQCNCNCNKKNL